MKIYAYKCGNATYKLSTQSKEICIWLLVCYNNASWQYIIYRLKTFFSPLRGVKLILLVGNIQPTLILSSRTSKFSILSV